MKTKIMAVVGMHRSATSGVAKGLHLAGWPMFPYGDKYLGKTDSNKWGHWEHKALVDLNDRILLEFGNSWDNPPHKEDVEARKCDFTDVVCDYINGRINKHKNGQWGIKDPRLVILWPIWEESFKNFETLDLIVVCPWRNKENIAESLSLRDKMNKDKSISIVNEYHLHQSTIRGI